MWLHKQINVYIVTWTSHLMQPCYFIHNVNPWREQWSHIQYGMEWWLHIVSLECSVCNRQLVSWPAGVPLSCGAGRPSQCSAGCSWPAAQRWSVSAGSSGAAPPAGRSAPSEASPPWMTHAPAAQRKQEKKVEKPKFWWKIVSLGYPHLHTYFQISICFKQIIITV